MRLFFLMFRIQYYIELLMYHSTNPIISGIGNLMQKIPIIQRRLERFGSRRDRYLGMTAAIPQVPVPTAMHMVDVVFSNKAAGTYYNPELRGSLFNAKETIVWRR